MKIDLNDLYTSDQAAAFLGISLVTLAKMIREGTLKPRKFGSANSFLRAELEKVKNQLFAEGLGHTEIAAMYGKDRSTVAYHFDRLHVKPKGINNSRRRARIYDLAAVREAAALLGWVEVRQSPTDAPLDRAHAAP